MKKLKIPYMLFAFVVGIGLLNTNIYALEKRSRHASQENINASAAGVREVTALDGAIFRITVIPPLGKEVDYRIFERIIIEPLDVENNTKMQEEANLTAELETLDLSDYQILIEMPRIEATTASCKGYRTGASNVTITSSLTIKPIYNGSTLTPEGIDGAAYPKTGDVDVYTYYYGGTLCSSSVNGPGYLDSAYCYYSNCSTTYNSYVKFVAVPSGTSTKFDWAMTYFTVAL